MRYRPYLLLFIILFSCAPKKSQIDFADIQNELNKKFAHGKKLFDKKKYARAKDDFDYIILNDRGSEMGKEARYYQAESLFKLKQYSDAISSYERFLQYSDDNVKKDEQIIVTPLNVDSHVIEFLDERDWKTKMVSLPWDWNNSRENVELAYIVDEWISLPMLTSQGDVQNHHADSNDT